ncbi:MAG TPA: hypothetical protein VJS44_13990 [Pyrinomonadaceae bacterium]|nr:hypothetical protein [Pyrinomonadaceae bacterium]
MNRRKALLTTSVLTLAFGVAPATVWVYRHKFSPGKRASNDMPLASAQVVSAAEQPPHSDTLSLFDDIFTKDDRLSYRGYVIEKSQDRGEDSWSASLKKGSREVAKFASGWNREWTNFGLFPFISREPRQLVVEQYSGGAHCCYSYWIYELDAQAPRLLFDSGKYGTGNQLMHLDVDSDGVVELTHSVMAFDYFHMSHASSVFPQAVFAYDKKAGEYRPANARFSQVVLSTMEDDLKELEALKARGNPDNDEIYSERYFSAVLQVTLNYIYAGQQEKGWQFFNREYRTHEGISREKMRAEIEETLRGEPVYKYIYSTKE